MLDTPDAAPLPCPTCHGFGYFASGSGGPCDGRRSSDCPDCHGRGHLRCEDCGEPATRTAAGDAHIKLCADCGAKDDREAAEGVAA